MPSDHQSCSRRRVIGGSTFVRILRKLPFGSLRIVGAVLCIVTLYLVRLWKRKRKLEKGLDVNIEAVHEFYLAIQEDPLLYPYFIDVKVDKREGLMQKIACSFYRMVREGNFTTTSLKRLRDIHHKMQINEAAYYHFTNLFAHICCKGKRDKLRARMLETSEMLKEYVCRNVINTQSMATFFRLAAPRGTRMSSSGAWQQQQCPKQVQGPRFSATSRE